MSAEEQEYRAWLGKKPDRCVPLTDQAIRAWFKTGTIIPPADYNPRGELRGAVLVGCATVFFLCAVALLVTWPMWSNR
jgi:hypothetical protein